MREFLTVEEAAAKYGVDPETVRRWVRAKKIEHVRFGLTIRIPVHPEIVPVAKHRKAKK